jgi:S1-C subfamily serine protease
MTMAATHPWARYFAALLFCGGLYLGFASAQEGADAKKSPPPVKLFELPQALNKPVPENAADLRDIEKHVQNVLEKVMPAVVGVRVGFGQGSGVIVSEDGTVLTAGHVSGAPNKNAVVVLRDGSLRKSKTLGQNKGIDSGMVKISAEGKYPFLEMGKSSELKPGQWVIAIGHPGGFRPNRTPVVRVGRILFANAFVIRTDCTLVGGDSGGPLFDMQGRVIGIHSRIGGLAITENMHVPVDTYRQTWDKLAKGESWGRDGQIETVRSAGGKVVFEKKDSLSKDDPKDKVQQQSHVKIYTFRMKAGHTYTLDLISGDRTGTKLDTFLRLENADGKEIAQDDDGGGFPHARIVYKALKEGDYRIIATSFEPGQTGPFTLKILDADFIDAMVSGKVEVLKAIKVPPPAVAPLVEKFGQAKVPLHVNAVVIDDKGNPMPNKEITVLWDKGKQTLKSNGEGIVRWQLLKDKSRKLALDLPKGTRALLALTDPEGNSIGLKFGKDDPSIETVKSAGGKIVETFKGAITKTDPFDLERDKCYRHIHDFKMVAGKTYTLDLVSEDFDAYLRVENDEKGKLAEDDDGGGFLNSRIVFTPAEGGTYRLVVTTCDPGQFGAYQLTIRETNAKPVEPKKDEKK